MVTTRSDLCECQPFPDVSEHEVLPHLLFVIPVVCGVLVASLPILPAPPALHLVEGPYHAGVVDAQVYLHDARVVECVHAGGFPQLLVGLVVRGQDEELGAAEHYNNEGQCPSGIA